jgi:hypothetical protein
MSDIQQGEPGRRLSARELLRAAFVDGDDPRFPWWLPVPGLLAAVGWAAYEAATGAGAFLLTALWPGAAILLLVTVVTFFGWQLDID